MQNTLNQSHKKNTSGYGFIWISLSLIYYIPSLVFIQFETSSLAAGLCIASLCIAALSFKKRYIRHINKKSLILFATASTLLISSSLFLFYTTSNKKPLASIIFIALAASSYLFSRKISEISTPETLKGIYYFLITTLILGWLSYFNLSDIGSYSSRYKPVAPFSEESHYALCIGFLAGAYSLVCKLRQASLLAANLLAQAVLLPNLTLLAFFTLLSLVLFARSNPKYFLATSAVLGIVLFNSVSFIISSNDYFSSRLDFNETNNLTTLVWLQGWDLARVNLIATNGLGLGFQMLGSEQTTLSSYSYLAEKIAGQYKNLQDGGFLAAKISAELGILGVILVCAYTTYLAQFLKTLNNKNKIPSLFSSPVNTQHLDQIALLFQGIIFFFIVEFFLRGYGYFSPSLFIFLTALFYLAERRPSPQ